MDAKEQARDVIAAVEVEIGGIPGGFVIGTETAATILAALAEAGLVIEQGWQPIETAPTMRNILLFAHTDFIGTELNYKMASGFWHSGKGAWEWEGREVKKWDWAPTHWRPLPTSPASPAPEAARDAAGQPKDQD